MPRAKDNAPQEGAPPEETQEVAEVALAEQGAAAKAETFEDRQAREAREAAIKRNAEAIAERREILVRNGAVDDTAGMDIEEMAKRCCS